PHLTTVKPRPRGRDPARRSREDLPHAAGRHRAGRRGRHAARRRERVRDPGGAERLRQEHAAQARGRADARHAWRGPRARHGRARAVSRRRLRVPAARAPALALGARQRALLCRDARAAAAPVPQAGGRPARADRARRLRDQASARALGRHAAARGDLPRAAARPEPAPDGRAVRRAGRHDARGDEPRAAPRLGGAAQDDPLRHPQHSRGHPARRPCGRDDGAAGPHRPRAHHRLAPPAHDGARVRSAVQGGERRGAQPHLRAPGARAVISRRVIADYLVPAATLVGVLVAWEAATHALRIPRFVMPPPSAILAEGWDWRYRFVEHTWVTLYETLGGFALSILVGVPLAVLIVYSPVMKSALYPLIVLAQSVPKIAIAPVLLLVLGHGEIPKVFVAFLVAFFPVVVDTATGLAATPPELLDLSRSYRASAFKTFVKVRLPMAMPFFFAGAKVA